MLHYFQSIAKIIKIIYKIYYDEGIPAILYHDFKDLRVILILKIK